MSDIAVALCYLALIGAVVAIATQAIKTVIGWQVDSVCYRAQRKADRDVWKIKFKDTEE